MILSLFYKMGSFSTGNQNLKKVNLSQNMLVDLSPQILKKLPQLETLDLSSNFIMGMSDLFFDEIEKRTKMRMVFFQVSLITSLLLKDKQIFK